MSDLYVTIGISGCGKSQWCEEQAGRNDVIVSSDRVRAELYGDAAIQENHSKVFSIVYQRTFDALACDYNVYFDATNLIMRYRRSFVKEVKKHFPKTSIHAIIVTASPETCIERDAIRERCVGKDVIMRQLRQFSMPTIYEGWDDITVVGTEIPNRRDFWEKIENFGSQHNHNHSLSLYEHCVKAGFYADEYDKGNYDLLKAAVFHDCGKIYTVKVDENGEYHFPYHANVSAYIGLNFGLSLHAATLIAFHMIFFTSHENQNKWRERLGRDFWEELIILHKCDVEAH